MEIRDLLSGFPLEVTSLIDYPWIPEIQEDGKTYVENAINKAKVVASYTGELSLGDDSGLEVFALGGEPGMMSSKFEKTDRERNLRLLSLMEGVPMEKRGALFRCVIALAKPSGDVIVATGSSRGLISLEIRGEGGFGYDPIFIVPRYNRTFGELPLKIKNMVSHRARAMRRLILREWPLFVEDLGMN